MSTDVWTTLQSGFLLAQQTRPGDVWEGWGSVLLVVGSTALVFVIVGVAVWQAFKTWQTKMTTQLVIAQDAAYRKLAEEATAAQQTIAAEQQKIAAELAEMRARMTAIEALLREVG